MTTAAIHLKGGEVLSVDGLTSIHAIYHDKSRTYKDSSLVSTPFRDTYAYSFVSSEKVVNLSGERIQYV